MMANSILSQFDSSGSSSWSSQKNSQVSSAAPIWGSGGGQFSTQSDRGGARGTQRRDRAGPKDKRNDFKGGRGARDTRKNDKRGDSGNSRARKSKKPSQIEIVRELERTDVYPFVGWLVT